jgi:serine phosphatase RsbU (regulator of sigma subunit)
LIQNSCHLTASEIIDILVKSVDEWMQGRPNPDDITLVVTKKKLN